MCELVVQASQHALASERLVFLNEGGIDAQRGELLAMIGLEKASARILENLRLDDAYAGQFGLDAIHELPTLTIVDNVPIPESFPLRYRAYPLEVAQIPPHRLFQPRLEALRGPPTRLSRQLRGIQRVPPVMPRAIRYMRD